MVYNKIKYSFKCCNIIIYEISSESPAFNFLPSKNFLFYIICHRLFWLIFMLKFLRPHLGVRKRFYRKFFYVYILPQLCFEVSIWFSITTTGL